MCLEFRDSSKNPGVRIRVRISSWIFELGFELGFRIRNGVYRFQIISFRLSIQIN